MLTHEDNDRLSRVEAGAPMGRLMREHYWMPFSLSAQVEHGDGPVPVRLLGENYVAFRAEDGRVGFFDELCPHRRASLVLGRVEGDGLRCIYHGWKLDVSGCVAEVPTQTIRPEKFAANVPVSHYPVHESGGLLWVWLGGGDPPPFPDLPWADLEADHLFWCVSRVPCNWLQGVEGTIDSAHAGWLHHTWLSISAQLEGFDNLNRALDQAPSYDTDDAPYGMRAAALRRQPDGRSYVRVTEWFMPLTTIVAVGGDRPNDGSMFVISPVDDTHHLVFYGYFGDEPQRPPQALGGAAPDYLPDPDDFAGLRGDRSNRWHQDRELMKAGHMTGFGRSLLEEDAVVQTSMGPITDRTREHLASSDVAVTQARRSLLAALDAVAAGDLPPGSARSPVGVRVPNALEVLVEEGERWEDAAFHRTS